MRRDFVDGVNYVLNIVISHAMEHREADEAIIGVFGHGIIAGLYIQSGRGSRGDGARECSGR